MGDFTMNDWNKWFDTIRKSTLQRDFANPMNYIHENSSIIDLPDRSRSTGDLIVLTAVRVAKDGCYDIFSYSLPSGKHFSASFPIPKNLQTNEHSHNYIELALVPDGEMNIQFGEHIESFAAGEICLIKRGLLHADCLKCDGTILLYLGFSDGFFKETFVPDSVASASDFIRDIIANKRMKHDFVRFSPKGNTSAVPDLYRSVMDEALEQKPGYIRLIKGYCERLLCLLPSDYQIALTNIERNEYMYYIYQDVASYIGEHYDSVTTKELSEVFGYNPDYFNRLIKRFSKKSYSELLQETRLKAAASFLETTKLPVDHIAMLVGYSNLGYFYRAFQTMYQCTPKKYRTRVAAEG